MGRKKTETIFCWELRSDRLNIFLASSENGATTVGINLKQKPDCMAYFEELYPTMNLRRDKRMNQPLIEAVEAALSNKSLPKVTPLDIAATPFQWEAWRTIAYIPYGQTMTYGEVALMMGKPGAAQAVGQAMGKNPLPLIFP
jgi:methylated-DNA-[protein]-cysteine S-methyltransferase